MPGLVQITFEGRQSVSDIQRKFKDQLSEKEILKTTAFAINTTAKRLQGHIRIQVRKQYTVKNERLKNMSFVSKQAAGQPSRLYAHVDFSYRPVPMIDFKHTGTPGSRRPVTVTIKKGQTKVFRPAFIKEKKNGGQGIFAQGRYADKKFSYQKDSKRITDLKSASPFTMTFSHDMQPKINEYVAKELPGRLGALLERKLLKMSKQ